MTATARTRGRKGQRIRERQLRLHPLCARCMANGVVTEATEVDHIVPLVKGGTDHESNLQSLCGPCHAQKTNEDLGRRAAAAGCDLSGMPVDPSHAWKR